MFPPQRDSPVKVELLSKGRIMTEDSAIQLFGNQENDYGRQDNLSPIPI
jgi:hypothetical protein